MSERLDYVIAQARRLYLHYLDTGRPEVARDFSNLIWSLEALQYHEQIKKEDAK